MPWSARVYFGEETKAWPDRITELEQRMRVRAYLPWPLHLIHELILWRRRRRFQKTLKAMESHD